MCIRDRGMPLLLRPRSLSVLCCSLRLHIRPQTLSQCLCSYLCVLVAVLFQAVLFFHQALPSPPQTLFLSLVFHLLLCFLILSHRLYASLILLFDFYKSQSRSIHLVVRQGSRQTPCLLYTSDAADE